MDEHSSTTTSLANRRSVLKTGGALAALGTAGCLGNQGSDSSGNGASTPNSDGSDGSDGSMDTPEEESSLVELAEEEGSVNIGREITGLDDLWVQMGEEYNLEVSDQRIGNIGRFLSQVQANNVAFDTIMPGEIPKQLALTPYFRDLPWDDTFADYEPYRIAERVCTAYIRLGVGLDYNTTIIDEPPSSISELTSGEWKIGIPTDTPTILLALRDRHGEEEGTQIMSNLADVGVMYDSKYTLGQDIASGEVPIGFTFEKYQWYDFGGDLGFTSFPEMPQLCSEVFGGVPKQAPNPNAGMLALRYWMDNGADFMKDSVGPAYADPGNSDEMSEIENNDAQFLVRYEDYNALDWEGFLTEYQEILGVA